MHERKSNFTSPFEKCSRTYDSVSNVRIAACLMLLICYDRPFMLAATTRHSGLSGTLSDNYSAVLLGGADYCSIPMAR